VFARVVALLLAVMMMTGAAAQASALANPASEVDDAPYVVVPIAPEPVAVAIPERRAPARIEAPWAPACGRIHALVIFRPPR
jgi:hypothetical protein